MSEQLLRVWPDMGRILQVGRSTAYDLVQTGEIPAVRISKSIVRVRREDVDRFIQTRSASGEH